MVSFSACSLVQGSEAKKVQSCFTWQSQAWILGATISEDKRKHKAESGTKPLREQDKFKTCTFQDNKDSGGVCGTDSASSLPRNAPQVNITKHQLGFTTSAASKVNSDPLMAVLDLQKGSCSWSVSDLVTICRRWCSSPTNKWMTSLASAAIKNKTLLHNLAWMQHSN